MINLLKKYLKIWYLMTVNSFTSMTVARFGGMMFLLGKILRFFFFLIFLLLLTNRTKSLGGYDVNQVVFFFLTFNLIDTTSQFFFREVYRFRQQVVSGDFDLVLIKPVNPLFRSLLGGADPFDLVMLIPFIAAIFFVGKGLHPSGIQVFLYLVLLIAGFTIAVAFHIAVLALGIITTEIDHAIMIYRDITSTGRVPIDIYGEPLRSFLTFAIPVGIMVTFPVKAFLGLLSFKGIILAMMMAGLFFWLSLRFWNYALTQYSSASS